MSRAKGSRSHVAPLSGSQSTPPVWLHFRIALLVSSVPLSETQLLGWPRRVISASSSRATRVPGNEVSGINARLSRVKSSTIARIRKRRPLLKQSDTKSSDQRSLGRSAAPAARARPRRACGRHAGALAVSLPGKAVESVCGSSGIPPVSATHASDGSRSGAACAPVLESATARRRRRHDSCGSASMRDLHPVSCTPAARSPHAPNTHEPRPAVWRRASPLS